MHCLQIIDLSRNEIQDLLHDTFRDNLIVRSIDLSHNKLRNFAENLFRNLQNLEILILDHNLFNCLPLSSLRLISSQLRVLSISNNKIRNLLSEEIQLINFNKLLKLDLANNLIKTINEQFFQDFAQLKELNLNGNQLRVISDTVFNDVTNSLEYLFMAKNDLRIIPNVNLRKLIKLDLSDNLINSPNSISFSNISQLKELNLNANQLHLSPANLWPQLSRLTKLHLSDNPINMLNNDSFMGLSNLIALELINMNNLKMISIGTLSPLVNLENLVTSDYSKQNTRLMLNDKHNNVEPKLLTSHNLIRFNIERLVNSVASLKRLTVVMNGTELQFPSKLPAKLKKIKITGSVFTINSQAPYQNNHNDKYKSIGNYSHVPSFTFTVNIRSRSGVLAGHHQHQHQSVQRANVHERTRRRTSRSQPRFARESADHAARLARGSTLRDCEGNSTQFNAIS